MTSRSSFGKADIIQGKADIKKCPLMTQSGLRVPARENLRYEFFCPGKFNAINHPRVRFLSKMLDQQFGQYPNLARWMRSRRTHHENPSLEGRVAGHNGDESTGSDVVIGEEIRECRDA
jgi:hypothetical protein